MPRFAAVLFCCLAFAIAIPGCGGEGRTAPLQDRQAVDLPTSVAGKVLLLLVHLLIIGTILLLIGVAVGVVVDETSSLERIILSSSLSAGFLAYTAARALGISIPSLLAQSLATSNPFGVAALGLIIPSMCGTFIAWFGLRMMKKDEDVAKRVSLVLGTFIITMFADVYAAMAGEIGLSQGKFALPNITFVLGMVFYTIFTYRRK